MNGFEPFYELVSDEDLKKIADLLRLGMPRNSSIRSVVFVSETAIWDAAKAGEAAMEKQRRGEELTHREKMAIRWYKTIYQAWEEGALRLVAKALKGEKGTAGAMFVLERTRAEFRREKQPEVTEAPVVSDASAIPDDQLFAEVARRIRATNG